MVRDCQSRVQGQEPLERLLDGLLYPTTCGHKRAGEVALQGSRIRMATAFLVLAATSGFGCGGGRPDVGATGIGGFGGGSPSEGGASSSGGSSDSAGRAPIFPVGTGGCSGAGCGSTTTTAPRPYCGDSKTNQDFEKCDDGNTNAGDGCGIHCELEAGWVCPTPGLPCVNTVVCNDGKVGVGESCDDRNTVDGDGCSSTCQVEQGYTCPVAGMLCRPVCGDSLILGNEQCDTGASDGTDGCSATCQLEPGWVCPQGVPCRKTVCGDSNKEGQEECDDGNTRPYDGCSPTCTLEPVCGSATSPVGKCASRCGDGILLSSAGEQCDDGNSQSGDGCSSDCKLEQGYDCVAAPTPASIKIPIVYRDFKAFSKWQGTGKTSPVGHPDFERTAPSYTDGFPIGSQPGIVTTQLGVDRKPTYNGTDTVPPGGASAETTGKLYFDQWFRDDVGTDASGAPINMRVDDALTLKRVGTTGANYSMDSRLDTPWSDLSGFFPLDGRGFGNEGSGSGGASHNYRFTSELRLWFEYKGNEKLEFSGDDDVWVFVDGKLAVDLGGIHCRQYGVVQLDTAGHGSSCVATASCSAATTTCTLAGDTDFAMTTGNIYEAVVFQAERHITESNYWLTLNNFLTGKTQCRPICGDRIVTPDEACDLGTDLNIGACGGCNHDCTPAPYCGNGVVDPVCGEQCDDGVNASLYGGCAPGCVNGPYCGDALVQAAYEQCDDGVNSGGYEKCGPGCVYGPRCGDGIVQSPQEQCDEGPNNGKGNCDMTCRMIVIL